jgi:glycosyltransferase involved in cell wall biosynthesis
VRILLDYRPALRERSGVGEFVHGLARALATERGGDEVALLTTSWRDRPSPKLAVELDGVRVIDRRIPIRALTWAWNRLEWPPVEWLAGGTDVVHSASPLLIPAARAAQVITVHDLHFLERPEHGEAEMRRDFPALVHDHASRADHVIAVSNYIAGKVISELKVSPDRVSVYSGGAPEWTTTVARQRAGRADGSLLLFIGTLEPRKNIRGLLEAYARLRTIRADAPPLILAGRVTDSARTTLEQAARPPLAGHVSVIGYVSEDERQRLYRQARLLILPSLEEGFGLPVLEAMACGVPVVISKRGSLPEVAGDAAEPVDPTDHAALAAEMDRLLAPEPAQDAIRKGLARASHYTWAAAASSARKAYRAAIAARAGRCR